MPEYVKDEADTLERLSELVEAVRYAEYELAAAVALLKIIGRSWEWIGEGMGFAEGGRKQGASQWFKRQGPRVGVFDFTTRQPSLSMLDDPDGDGPSERARLARVLGLGTAAPRYQVRLVTAGRHGINKVHYRHVSTHLSSAKAWERADKTAGEVEVWRVDPDGIEYQIKSRPKATGAGSSSSSSAGSEEPF